MCGLTGFVNLSGAPADPDVLDRMMAVIRHRGPDEEGRFIRHNVALGVQRLSIVDVEGGHQPLFNESGTIALGCNGEIFEYPLLKADLEQRGHRFRTRTDVEAIVHLYEEYGTAFLRNVNGQFAFVLIDQRDGAVLLARDPFGICPFFYTVTSNVLVFASEIKSILEHPLVRRAVDIVGLDQLLSFPGLVGERTMFEGIHALGAGHYLQVRGSSIDRHQYWDLEYPRATDVLYQSKESDVIERASELLHEAVRCRLQADVPVGVYLSGGLDSSLIAAHVPTPEDGGRLRTFSVEFSDPAFSEERYQTLVSTRFGTEHHRTCLAVPEIARLLRRAVYHSEMPLKETYNTACLSLSEAAQRAGVKVVLCGEGADELYAGYAGYRFDRFRTVRAARQTRDAAEDARRMALWGDRDIVYERFHHQFDAFKRDLFSPAVNRTRETAPPNGRDWISRDRLAGRDPLHQRAYLDFKIRLGGHLLADHGDRMAMANSVEARYPFLDLHLVRFTTQVSPHLKLNGYTEKYLLKQLGRRCLPPEIVEREKFPFSAPGSPAFLHFGELTREYLDRELLSRQGYFNPAAVDQLLQRYSAPGFKLEIPYDDDVVLYVLTFGMLLQAFDLPSLT